MSKNVVAQGTKNVRSAVKKKPSRRPLVNFVIPEGIDPDSLTLKNYYEVTKKRFRMNNDQAKIRQLSREEAFNESRALAVSQLGG